MGPVFERADVPRAAGDGVPSFLAKDLRHWQTLLARAGGCFWIFRQQVDQLVGEDENTASARKQVCQWRKSLARKKRTPSPAARGTSACSKRAPSECGAALCQLVFVTRRSTQLAEAHRKKLISHGYSEGHARLLELQVPKEGGKYMLTSLAKYNDIEPVRKLVGNFSVTERGGSRNFS